MPFYYSNVPLVNEDICPTHLQHNYLANQFNLRLKEPGPSCAWSIFYYANSIFTNMRNMAGNQLIPGLMGRRPPEDEWWKIYAYIEHPTAETGEGNWPLVPAGFPEGANVMNPVNAYIFGRITAENRPGMPRRSSSAGASFENVMNDPRVGPWAEGNIFDGLVEGSRAALSNRAFWEMSFRQRGTIKLNAGSVRDVKDFWDPNSVWGDARGKLKTGGFYINNFLPSISDPFFITHGLWNSGRSSDKYWKEYSNTLANMRYAPQIYGEKYTMRYGRKYRTRYGKLKRKNATKQTLHWCLWAYTFYFRGSEQQRSLFCKRKTWLAPMVDIDSTTEYQGQQSYGISSVATRGPLDICKVGFDYFTYFTRQNVLAPSLAVGTFNSLVDSHSANVHQGILKYLNGTGTLAPKGEVFRAYRPIFGFDLDYLHQAPYHTEKCRIKTARHNSNITQRFRQLARTPTIYTIGGGGPTGNEVSDVTFENYDDVEIGQLTGGKLYGQCLRFNRSRENGKWVDASERKTYNRSMLLKSVYDNSEGDIKDPFSNSNLPNIPYGKKGDTKLDFDFINVGGDPSVSGRWGRYGMAMCLAGYYFQTTPVENPAMRFKLRVWREIKGSSNKVVHESLIDQTYSYAVNRKGTGEPAYVYNKMFYFKNPYFSGKIRFEIVPLEKDIFLDDMLTVTTSADGSTVDSLAKKNYLARVKNQEGYDQVISFGNPHADGVQHSFTGYTLSDPGVHVQNLLDTEIGWGHDEPFADKNLLWVPSSWSGVDDTRQDDKLQDGSAIRIKIGTQGTWKYVRDAQLLYVKISETNDGLSANDPNWIVGNKRKMFISERRDSRCFSKSANGDYLPIADLITGLLGVGVSASAHEIEIEKISLSDEATAFSARLEPAVLLRQKPNFQDAYALLRVATEKQNRKNTRSSMIIGDMPGVGTVGHDFTQSKQVFYNYLRYGNAQNIYGGDAVPALRTMVSANPIYESIRKFVSSYMRLADRVSLLGYAVETIDGERRGVLFFKRFASWIPQKAKATVLRNIEPSCDPVGRFYKGSGDVNDIGHDKYRPILPGVWYYVHAPYSLWSASAGTYTVVALKYNGSLYYHGNRFVGQVGKEFLEEHSGPNSVNDLPREFGPYEIEGIRNVAPLNGTSNQWVMSMNSNHYSPSKSSIYKPSVFNDIVGFQNNRCHHRALDLERNLGIEYDMIREELMFMKHVSFVPGPRLRAFISKSSKNHNYIFNVNDPIAGNLDIYRTASGEAVKNYVTAYRKSCPAVEERGYEVISCTLVDSNHKNLYNSDRLNPSAVKGYTIPKTLGGYTNKQWSRLYKRSHEAARPAQIVKVVLNQPLRGTGDLYVGDGGAGAVFSEILKEEPQRSDENAVVEYLTHKGAISWSYKERNGLVPIEGRLNRAKSYGYHCNRMMIGDYGASSNVHTDTGRPFGACFPRFYFLKLIPFVASGAMLDSEPYAQMDFYLRAMAGSFVKGRPDNIYSQLYNTMETSYFNRPGRVNSEQWKQTELLSKSAQEDPTSYHYIDPKSVSTMGNLGGNRRVVAGWDDETIYWSS